MWRVGVQVDTEDMTSRLLKALVFVTVTVSILCGVLGVLSLATGRLWATAALAILAAATARAAFSVSARPPHTGS